MLNKLLVSHVILLNAIISYPQKFMLDTNYVETFKNKFILVLHLSGQYNTLNLQQTINKPNYNTDLSYPVSRSSVGFTFNYKWITFSYGRNIKPIFTKNPIEQIKNTKITNYAFTYNPNRFRIEMYYRKTRGFFEENRAKYDSTFTSHQTYYQYPDLISTSYGADIIWCFNGRKRFSIGAPYSYTTRQKKTSGSFLFYFGLNSFNLNNPNTFIPHELSTFYGDFGNLNSFHAITLSWGCGWSQTLVIAKVFFINATLIGRYPYMFKKYKTTDGKNIEENTEPEDPEVISFAIARAAAGINFKQFFLSVYSYADMYEYKRIKNKELEMGIKNLNVRGAIMVGMRFNKLKKPSARSSI